MQSKLNVVFFVNIYAMKNKLKKKVTSFSSGKNISNWLSKSADNVLSSIINRDFFSSGADFFNCPRRIAYYRCKVSL